MTLLANGALVSVRDLTATYDDVVLAGLLTGRWDHLLRWSTEGQHRAATQQAAPDVVRHVAENFRRQRRLESGEDLRAWLEERQISVADWESYVHRDVLMGTQPLLDAVQTRSPDELGPALRVDAFCGGFVEATANDLVNWMSASTLVGPDRLREPDIAVATARAESDGIAAMLELDSHAITVRLGELDSWFESYQRVAGVVGTESAIDSVVERRWLDWSILDIEVLEVPNESAAREAVMCATEDGLDAAAIAQRAGTTLHRRHVRSDQLDRSLAATLLSSPANQPVGPIRYDGAWSVLWVRGHTPADRTDPEVRAGAIAALVDEAIDSNSRGHVRWHAAV